MAGSVREDALTSAAYGLLANTLLDCAIFVLVVAGTALMSDETF